MATREKLWVVRPGDGATLSDIVRRAGEDPNAIAEGRVFVGKKRATRGDQLVRPGDAVRIGRAAPSAGAGAGQILFERDGLIACVKPAGIPTVPDHEGSSHALVAQIARTIGRSPQGLVVTSRLDRDVSGVVIFALDAAAEQRLRTARAEGRYHRRYVAVAGGDVGREGVWRSPIGRAGDPRLRRAEGPEAKAATTRWTRVATASTKPYAMLAVDPVTGRTHQIRVHASHAGAPLVGDADYGGAKRIVLPTGAILTPSRVALHAARVIVPGLREPIEALAPIPPDLASLWSSLGGASDAFTAALAASTPDEGETGRREGEKE
jgi:23S rRNA-/tRNA-specific pseudouridylate synthase